MMSTMRSVCRRMAAMVAVLLSAWSAQAQVLAQTRGAGAIEITITTQSGTILLPGVSVRVASVDDHTIVAAVSDGEGLMRVGDLAPGTYQISASLAGFDEAKATVKIEGEAAVKVALDLRLSGISEQVNVIGNAETAPPTIGEGLSTKGVLDSRIVEQLPVRDHSVLSALKLLAGIVDGPGGVSIKGGRTNQSGVQIGMATQTDTSTGAPLFRLPVDAIDTVEVLPNPYAVEFGRFSSGLTLINTKRGGDVWRVALNTPDLSFRTVRDEPWHIIGLESFGPRIGVGGPIIKNKLFLEQSAQFRYEVSEVWSRPSDQTKTNKWLSAFTRLDANLTPKNSLIGSVNIFRSRAENTTLSTFNSPDVAPHEYDHLLSGSLAAHSTLTDKIVFESTVQVTGFSVEVDPHGGAPMQLIPSANLGNFFNHQDRTTTSFQAVEALTGSHDWGRVTHLFKVGLDAMYSTFDGLSDSRTVFIRRDDQTLARLLTFGGPVEQRVGATDLALFAQDRVQPFPRLLLEFGGRVDHDGVLARTNATPRFGAVLLMTPKGTAALRGGYGLFFERTPSVVGAFDQLDTSTELRFAPDGVTSLGPARVYRHVAADDLDVARSATWNLQYDQRLMHGLSFRASVLSRRGSDELIVNPTDAPLRGITELRLSSRGRSAYTEGEVTLRFAPSRQFEVGATYARSSAFANLNAYTSFFDNVRWPVIGRDEYAPTANHVPNRLVAHTRTIFWNRVLVSSILELHSGFPYSVTNDMLDWVGPRNQVFHFPTFALLDLDVEHRFTFIKGKPWIGLRAYNALNRFTPTEVQGNLSSPLFGTFYNSYGRQIRLQVRIEP